MSFELRFWKMCWFRITFYSNSNSIQCSELICLPVLTTGDFGIRAKLVVLSCCHSARGKASKARSVLMSLWAVNDGATKAFMNIFYKFLIREKLSASESLHQTMRKMRESALYSEREHWAPFVLLGDDVTLTF